MTLISIWWLAALPRGRRSQGPCAASGRAAMSGEQTRREKQGVGGCRQNGVCYQMNNIIKLTTATVSLATFIAAFNLGF
jgi:hypothetical protein